MYPVEASIETASYRWFSSRCILKDTTLLKFASKRSSEFNKKWYFEIGKQTVQSVNNICAITKQEAKDLVNNL